MILFSVIDIIGSLPIILDLKKRGVQIHPPTATLTDITELFTAFGEKGLPAEVVANRVAKLARHFHDSTAVVGEHLADQLVLPLALAGAGSFTTVRVSSHLQTNVEVFGKFLPVEFVLTETAGAHRISLL